MNAFLFWVAVALVAFVLYMSAIIASLARQQKIAQKSGAQDHFIILKNSWDWKWYCFLWNFTPWTWDKKPSVYTRCQYLRTLMFKPLALPILGPIYLTIMVIAVCFFICWNIGRFCWQTVVFRTDVPNGMDWDEPPFVTYRPVSKLHGLGLWPVLVLLGLWLRYGHKEQLMVHDFKIAGYILLAAFVIFLIVCLSKTGTGKMARKIIKDNYRKICPLVDVIDDPRARSK